VVEGRDWGRGEITCLRRGFGHCDRSREMDCQRIALHCRGPVHPARVGV